MEDKVKTKTCSKCGEERPATTEFFHKGHKGCLYGVISRCKACMTEYRQQRVSLKKEQDASYYINNKDKKLEQSREYYFVNKEKLNEYNRDYYRTPRGKFSMIRKNAKQRGLLFELQYEYYESNLWGKPCHYCGIDLEATGLDRKDSKGGYTKNNIVPSCLNCNSKKGTTPYEEYANRSLIKRRILEGNK
jgi:hypothetical protein